MNELKAEVGKRIAELRKSKKLKQEDLKELIDAPTVQLISGWENGHSFPSTSYLIILAKKLDTSLDYLLLGKKQIQNKKEILTYKDAAECMIGLANSGLFNHSSFSFNAKERYGVQLISYDNSIAHFEHEFEKITAARESLKPELFDLAVNDLLEKYDFVIKKPNK